MEYLTKHNFKDTFAVCTAVLGTIIEELNYCGNSTYYINESIDEIIEFFYKSIFEKVAAITVEKAA